MFTNKAKYAVIALIDIIENSYQNEPVSLASISGRQNIPLSFLEQIFSTLKKERIVKSIRGVSGGYILVKDPQKINLADIIFAIEKPIKMTRCGSKNGCITKKVKCRTHHMWQGLEKNINDYLSSISIYKIYSES